MVRMAICVLTAFTFLGSVAWHVPLTPQSLAGQVRHTSCRKGRSTRSLTCTNSKCSALWRATAALSCSTCATLRSWSSKNGVRAWPLQSAAPRRSQLVERPQHTES